MPTTLENLNEDAIRDLVTPAVFTRGETYYGEGRVIPVRRERDCLSAQVQGTRLYEVRVCASRWGLRVQCTCPYAWGIACKHGVATLLAYLHEPEAFVAVADIERVLKRRKKAELVDLLLRAIALYPELPRLLDLGATPEADADAIG